MGWLKDIFTSSKQPRETVTRSIESEGSLPRRGYTYDEFAISSQPALCVATVYRCVKLLSESVAQLPIRCQKLSGGVYIHDDNNPLNYLLSIQPNETTNAFDFWAQAIVNMLTDGNAYIVPGYDLSTIRQAPIRLVLCERGTVLHDTTNDTYTVEGQGISGTYEESEIIHFKGFTWRDPKKGISVLDFARQTIDIAGNGDRATNSNIVTGGNVRGIVSNDSSVRGFGEYQDSELAKTAVDIDGRFRSGERIVSLPGQVHFSPISLGAADMQLLESRKFTVREICRFFGVHPSFVFDDTSNNYKSAEMANAAFLSNTLNPMLRKIEIELLRKLVSPELATKRRFRFDRIELLSCDLESRAKYQAQTVGFGLYTPNEWRAVEGKRPIEGGNKAFISANLKSIDEFNTANE